MDTSKKYIKMCEKAPKELWDLVKDRNGTFFAWRGFLGILKPSRNRRPLSDIAEFIPETLVARTWLNDIEDLVVIDKVNYGTDRGTPLYRQDQLQEMISIKNESAFVIQMIFESWFDDFNPDEWIFDWSMEMLWLAFLMEHKYQKIWDDEKEEWTKK